MPAVWLRARAELRARWRSALGLAVLVGLAAGTVLALTAGGRRTDGAYPRFLREQRAWDVAMASSEFPELLDRAASLPQVAETAEFRDTEVHSVVGYEDEIDVPLDVNFSVDGAYGTRINRLKILEGRAPDPDRPDEVALGFTGADELGLEPGDTVQVVFADPRSDAEQESPQTPGPTVTFRVVGIEASPGEFPPQISLGGSSAHATPAFAQRYAGRINTDRAVALRLRRGEDDIPAFTRALQRLTGGRQAAFMLFQRDNAANVQRSFHLQAVALWVVAGLFAFVAVVVVAQLLRRQAALDAPEEPTLAALGLTRGQLRGVAVIQVLPVALVAAVLAAATAVMASAVFPLGLARKAETDGGIQLDLAVVVLGGLATAVVVLALAGVPAWRAAGRRAGAVASAPERPSRVAAVARGVGVPSLGLGTGMAFEPGRERTAVPVRSTIVATVVAVTALTGALTFGASLSRLLDTPQLYGWNWDVTTQGSISDLHDRILPKLRSDERVEDVSLSSTGISLTMRDVRADLLLLAPVKGDLEPVILEGRAPRGPDEMLLGTVTLRKLGADVGDRVPTAVTGISTQPRRLVVVGRGVLPTTTEVGRLGEGALLRPSALSALVPPELFEGETAEEGFDSAAIRFAPGADGSAVLRDVRQLGEVTFVGPERPSDLVNFGRIERLPFALGGLLAVLGAAVLAYLLTTSVSRRARELAVLKALGLRPRQVRAVVAWQATAVAVAALLVGLPLGIAAGRWAWGVFADQLGVPSRPRVPLGGLLLLVPGALLVANVAGALPGRAAARLRPTHVLRAE